MALLYQLSYLCEVRKYGMNVCIHPVFSERAEENFFESSRKKFIAANPVPHRTNAY